jgi:hypothetical protein
MEGKSVDEVTNETIKNGGVLAYLYFDLHATKSDVLQQLGVAVVHKMLNERGVVFALGEIEKPMETDGVFSTSVQIKILVESFADLVRICSDYSPVAVEILRPDEIKLSIGKAQVLLMDVSVHSHQLKKTLIEKTYTREDWEKVKKVLEQRKRIGEELMKKIKKKGD